MARVNRTSTSSLGFVQRSADLRLGFAHTPDPQAIPGTGPWTLEVSSPEDGPFVLLETLRRVMELIADEKCRHQDQPLIADLTHA